MCADTMGQKCRSTCQMGKRKFENQNEQYTYYTYNNLNVYHALKIIHIYPFILYRFSHSS